MQNTPVFQAFCAGGEKRFSAIRYDPSFNPPVVSSPDADPVSRPDADHH
jgi:hypothetical protein